MADHDGFRAVLFDWDGTLVDSAAKSYRCYVRVFAAYGIDFDHAAFERTYSPDWYRTYEAVGVPRERWPEADARWIECYGTEASRLVPGAREALERLTTRAVRQGLVSSGDGARVRRELTALGVEGFFDAVVCGGETSRRKPDPEPLLLALERLGVPPKGAVYIGDSPEDMAMAKAAGVFAVGVPGGFPNREALAASRPDLLASTLGEALRAILGEPAAR
jgi:HAD superfamily hydrolase (TIGR01549 family)